MLHRLATRIEFIGTGADGRGQHSYPVRVRDVKRHCARHSPATQLSKICKAIEKSLLHCHNRKE